MAFAPSELQEISDLRVAIKEYVNQSTAKFITGAMDIDTEWDAYLNQLDKLGLERFLEMNQTVYDRMFK